MMIDLSRDEQEVALGEKLCKEFIHVVKHRNSSEGEKNCSQAGLGSAFFKGA
jgi:hypothetical protein